jgi:hypothetical protein
LINIAYRCNIHIDASDGFTKNVKPWRVVHEVDRAAAMPVMSDVKRASFGTSPILCLKAVVLKGYVFMIVQEMGG